MRIWPVIIDSQPTYLRGRGRSASLLLAPLGTNTLLEHLVSSFVPITGNAPVIVAPENAEELYVDWVKGLCPTASVAGTALEFANALSSHELSDALLVVDPRCMPVDGFQFSELMHRFTTEPRIVHHLVAFERAFAGTKERVCFDSSGHIRSIQRYYEQATWPFVSGITATLVPCSSGVPGEGFLPRSLSELRQTLVARGVPSCDMPIAGGALDLGEERGVLAANEKLVLRATLERDRGGSSSGAPFYIGEGHRVHPTARVLGPVVLHRGACISAHATVVGPAVIGAGACIESGAVVAHATIGSDCTVPSDVIVRDRAWFRSPGYEEPAGVVESDPMTYDERLARLSIETDATPRLRHDDSVRRRVYLGMKRALDFAVAAITLFLTAPLFGIVAAAIRLESQGPVFYGDKREGWNGRVFRCWKFRTMYTGAHLAQRELKGLDHTDGPHFKIDRDPRVSKVGRILRALNLDEVPQLINVLLGEMSLVGPRPSPFRENQVCVPWREARLSVRPGITGFWQVCRHDRSSGDFHQWIEYDLLYVQNLSLALDFKILAATILTLGGKAQSVPASWLVRTATREGSTFSPALARGRSKEAIATLAS